MNLGTWGKACIVKQGVLGVDNFVKSNAGQMAATFHRVSMLALSNQTPLWLFSVCKGLLADGDLASSCLMEAMQILISWCATREGSKSESY